MIAVKLAIALASNFLVCGTVLREAHKGADVEVCTSDNVFLLQIRSADVEDGMMHQLDKSASAVFYESYRYFRDSFSEKDRIKLDKMITLPDWVFRVLRCGFDAADGVSAYVDQMPAANVPIVPDDRVPRPEELLDRGFVEPGANGKSYLSEGRETLESLDKKVCGVYRLSWVFDVVHGVLDVIHVQADRDGPSSFGQMIHDCNDGPDPKFKGLVDDFLNKIKIYWKDNTDLDAAKKAASELSKCLMEGGAAYTDRLHLTNLILSWVINLQSIMDTKLAGLEFQKSIAESKLGNAQGLYETKRMTQALNQRMKNIGNGDIKTNFRNQIMGFNEQGRGDYQTDWNYRGS